MTKILISGGRKNEHCRNRYRLQPRCGGPSGEVEELDFASIKVEIKEEPTAECVLYFIRSPGRKIGWAICELIVKNYWPKQWPNFLRRQMPVLKVRGHWRRPEGMVCDQAGHSEWRGVQGMSFRKGWPVSRSLGEDVRLSTPFGPWLPVTLTLSAALTMDFISPICLNLHTHLFCFFFSYSKMDIKHYNNLRCTA